MKPYFETKLGKLYHSDNRDILPSLDPIKFILLTDPPYGEATKLDRESENKKEAPRVLGGMRILRKDWKGIKDTSDPVDVSPLLNFKQAIIWGGNYYADQLPYSKKWLIWDKLIIPPSNHHDGELAWTNLKGVTRIHRQLWRGVCRAGEENNSKNGKLHPFQKPVALFQFCINQFNHNGEIILDPYAGSSTTAVVCERNNLKWIAIELMEECCEISAKRLEKEIEQPKFYNSSIKVFNQESMF